MGSDRLYDIVVFGATGFTGRLVAEYLARKNQEESFRWAIAGRNAGRLAEIKRAVEALGVPRAGEIGVLEASAEDPTSLERMAEQTRVVLTTVGPYARYGEPVVEASIRAGTDYVDITGEPAFVDRLLERHDEAARQRGVRIVNCCGFDSIPHDLGAFFTVQKLPKSEPITLEGFVRARGTFSGGTWQSAINAFADLRGAKLRRGKSHAMDARRVRGIKPQIRYDRELKSWVCPMPTIDPQIVLRSARGLEAYGPDFRYGHNLILRTFAQLTVLLAGVGTTALLAQLGPTRKLLEKVRSSGEGPSEAERAKGWFQVTFRGQTASRKVVTRVSGGDPGYTETAKMCAESALCLSLDREKLPNRAGILTPTLAMEEAIITRLRREGILFEVLEEG